MQPNDESTEEYCATTNADATPDRTGERAEPEIDIPESFETLEAALSAHTTTPRDDLPRCCECDSTDIKRKVAPADHPLRQPGEWRCNHCGHHFETPKRGGTGEGEESDSEVPIADGGETVCELCEEPIEGQPYLTADGHPEGPNRLVCADCDDLDHEGRPEANGGVAVSGRPPAGSMASHLRCAIKQIYLAHEAAPDEWFSQALTFPLDDIRELYRVETGEQVDLRGDLGEVAADD